MAMAGEDKLGLYSIFSWQGDGLSFKIHSRQGFKQYIMPKYFPRIKHASFVRQMALYGFKKCEDSGERRGGEYATRSKQPSGWCTNGCFVVSKQFSFAAMYHEFFIRGMPELAQHIEKVGKKKQPNLVFKRTAYGILPVSGDPNAVSDLAPNTQSPTPTPTFSIGHRASLPSSSSATVNGMNAANIHGGFAPQLARASSATLVDHHIPYQEPLTRSTSEPAYGFFYPVPNDDSQQIDETEINGLLDTKPSPASMSPTEALCVAQLPARVESSYNNPARQMNNPFLDIVLQNMQNSSSTNIAALQDPYQPTLMNFFENDDDSKPSASQGP